jgi:Zn-dependent peptidase ImmA (M78 family)
MKMERTDEKFCGPRLRVARSLYGFSQTELAELSGVSRALIAAVELGQREPARLVVEAFSDVLGFEPTFFTGEPLDEFEESQCFFRRKRLTPAPIRTRARAHGTLLVQLLKQLQEDLSLPPVDLPRLPQASRDTERTADLCRLHWGLGLDVPIKNLARVLENAGVPIATFKGIGDKVDAFSRFGDPSVIVVNEKAASRRRFDLAHECGHLVLHGRKDTGDRKLETEADAFAGALLLPRAGMVREFPRSMDRIWDKLLMLKRRWKVSLAALIVRAHELRLINAAQYLRLYKQLSLKGWLRHEPGEFEIERPEVLEVAFEHVDPLETASALGWKPQILESVTGLKVYKVSEPTVALVPGKVVDFKRRVKALV